MPGVWVQVEKVVLRATLSTAWFLVSRQFTVGGNSNQ
jgi:hypothetical protein